MTLRIVFADNDAEFLDIGSKLLQQAGFVVHAAGSVAEAREILEKVWVHVAVLDIRLEDDKDEGDISGIELAKDVLYETIPKIIITNYPTYEHVKAALGPRLPDLPPAVDFLAKKDGIEALIETIEKVSNTFAMINWSLRTHWEKQGLSYAALAEQLTSSRKTSYLVDYATEIEDLFRMLFAQYSQITVGRILWQQHNRVALVVFAFSEGMPGQQVVVTCGVKSSIQLERENISKLGNIGFLTGNMRPVEQKNTLHYAANVYELPGSDLESIRTFEDVYRQSNLREINNTLQNLVQHSLNMWYNKQRIGSSEDLVTMLWQRFNVKPHEDIVIDLALQVKRISKNSELVGLATIVRMPEALQINPPGNLLYSFPDPVSWLSNAHLIIAINTPVLLATTLGNLRFDTILADSNGRTWLSDFSELAEGPILADFAALETSIKFDLAEGENLVDLHEFEQLLMAPERLDGRMETGPVSLRKAMSVIQRVRSLAVSVCGDDFRQYLLALAYHAIRRILSYEAEIKRARRDVLPAVHACLSLGVILDRLSKLNPEGNPTMNQRSSSLDVDEVNRQVFVDGQVAALSPTEFNVVHYLWQRAGQLCSRAALFEAVYGQPYQQGKAASDDAQLNMLIKRVREAIELNPANPQYLVTKRGEGFTLFLHGKP
jgi:DNA-binding response OmpR family regulator